MNRKQSIGKNLSGIKDWIGSYLLVLIIPIIICSVFFLYIYLVIWEEVNNSNTVALQIVADELDDIFTRTFTVEYAIQRNSKIENAEQIMLPLDLEKRTDLMSASLALDECMVGETTIISTWQLFYPSSELVLLTGQTYTDLDGSYVRLGESLGYSIKQWGSMLKKRHDRTFLYNNKSADISYITSLPLNGDGVKMNVILTLRTDYIQKILGMLDDVENSAILLMDKENQIITSRNLEALSIDDFSEDLSVSREYERISIDGMDMMVACNELEQADLKVVSIIPYKEFWSTALESLSLFWSALALCIFSGLAVSYVFSLWKHRTWGKLNAIAKSRIAGNSNVVSRNKEIAEAIEGIVEEYDSMQSRLVSADKMKRELLVISALKGRIRAEEIETVFRKNNVNFEIGNYVVVLFKLNGFERYFDVEEQKVSEEDIHLIKQAIASIVQELNQKEFPCEILNLDEKLVCIVDFGTLDKDACHEQITQLVHSSRELALERLSVLLTISISDVHKHIFSLQNAYSEAFRVMEYQMTTGDELVMNYMEMVKKTQKSYLYSLENETTLIQWIYEGKEKEALQLFEEIYEKNIVSTNGSEELSKCLMWDMTASVLRAEVDLSDKIGLQDIQELLEHINSENTLYEAKNILKERIKELCREAAKSRGAKGHMIAEQMKEYVHKHYDNPNLSNSEIAEHFCMHATYASAFFKEKTGINLLTYIQKVRLEKAKELLETTDLTMEEISGKVGCSNSISLTRMFKKYENITPAAYRKKSRGEQKQ